MHCSECRWLNTSIGGFPLTSRASWWSQRNQGRFPCPCPSCAHLRSTPSNRPGCNTVGTHFAFSCNFAFQMHNCKYSFTLELLMPYIERTLEPVIRRAAQEFPVVVLTGPRQSGKTTLLRHFFAAGYRYASLDTLDVRAAASDDPRGFLALYPPPVIFDEVQHVPELLSYIKERVDADRGRAEQYILTRSQNLLLA